MDDKTDGKRSPARALQFERWLAQLTDRMRERRMKRHNDTFNELGSTAHIESPVEDIFEASGTVAAYDWHVGLMSVAHNRGGYALEAESIGEYGESTLEEYFCNR